MLDCDGISLSFPGKPVLSGCALHLGAQEHAALMGPSGCGKTSLLRIVLSLQQPDAGSVRLRAKRPAAVFQEPRLLPWRTALENLLLVLPDRPESRELGSRRAFQGHGRRPRRTRALGAFLRLRGNRPSPRHPQRSGGGSSSLPDSPVPGRPFSVSAAPCVSAPPLL